MDISREIGSKIKYYRRKRHMTIDELAEHICKSRSCISKYENGRIALDVCTLYDIAEALKVSVSQLMCADEAGEADISIRNAPLFFAGLKRLYGYYFDGRTNSTVRIVTDIEPADEQGVFPVDMYMNVCDYDNYRDCENTYRGTLRHFDSISIILLQNKNMPMEQYQIGIPSPYMNAESKWTLAFGISSRPLMPTSARLLLSKNIADETAEFEKSLHISKDDIRLLKMYNMLTVF